MSVEFIPPTISLNASVKSFQSPFEFDFFLAKAGWKSSQSCFPLRPSRIKHHARAATINRLSPWRRQEIQNDTESYYQRFKEEGKHSHVQLRRHSRKYLTFPLRMRHDCRCIYSFHIHFIPTSEGGLKLIWHDQIRFFFLLLTHYTDIANPAEPLKSGNPGCPVCIDNTTWAAYSRTICSKREE